MRSVSDQKALQSLDLLEQRVSHILRMVPGARTLLLFGSRVAVRDDPFADLDLHLITDDMLAARRVWPGILGEVAPLEIVWPITSVPENTAFGIVWRGVSPYHKLDVSLGNGPGLPPPLDATPSRALWRQEPGTSAIGQAEHQAYQPIWGSYGHVIVEELFSGIRYLKARRRGHLLTAWRFVRSKPDLLLSLLAAEHAGSRPPAPLSTWAIKALEGHIAASELALFFAMLDWRDSQAMDRSCIELNRRIVQAASRLAERAGEPLPAQWIDQQMRFLEQELAYA